MTSWNKYIEYKANQTDGEKKVYKIYERALKQLPYSYKMWNNYLRLRRTYMLQKSITDEGYKLANEAHEKALLFMHKMPRIWIEYLKFLIYQRFITKTRETFDEALKALPITQHYRIWELYIKFANFFNVKDTVSHIYQRYIKVIFIK